MERKLTMNYNYMLRLKYCSILFLMCGFMIGSAIPKHIIFYMVSSIIFLVYYFKLIKLNEKERQCDKNES
jgi:hypothetical protein